MSSGLFWGLQNKENLIAILFSVTETLFLLGISWSSDNITASNKNSTSKKEPYPLTSVFEITSWKWLYNIGTKLL